MIVHVRVTINIDRKLLEAAAWPGLLFGSRARDDGRGGDIDLPVSVPRPVSVDAAKLPPLLEG